MMDRKGEKTPPQHKKHDSGHICYPLLHLLAFNPIYTYNHWIPNLVTFFTLKGGGITSAVCKIVGMLLTAYLVEHKNMETGEKETRKPAALAFLKLGVQSVRKAEWGE